jgi:hypothetical protein
LLGVGDPSSHAVVDDREGTPAIETTRTPGIALLAWSVAGEALRADSLGPAVERARRVEPGRLQILLPAGGSQRVVGEEIVVTSPDDRLVVWNGWEMPITHERVKTSARFVREAFEGMESRDASESTKVERGR